MKRPSLKAAVEWIAHNDEPSEMDEDVMSGFPSVALIADLFGIEAIKVAQKVIRKRKDEARLEGRRK